MLTSFAGDPDLCLTRNISALMDRVPRFPLGGRTTGAGYLAEACTWQSSLLGTDVITVSETDAHGGQGACSPLRTLTLALAPCLHRTSP